ncbi:MAG: serine/threonine protein kinase [Planctomycetales bacterium]|nr:serine/threonine protein kinase [Planctomycetales bacterium]
MPDSSDDWHTLSGALSKQLFSGNVDNQFSLADYFADTQKTLSTQDLDIIAVDQLQRWMDGKPLNVEVYVSRFPELSLDHQRLLDIVYQEFLLRELHGPAPEIESFVRRFPHLADDLRAQIAFHQAIDAFSESCVLPGYSGTGTVLAPGLKGLPGSSKVPPPHAILPDFANRYRPVDKLGSGGMADVWLAHDIFLDRLVALKLPRKNNLGDDKVNDRFGREAKALAALHHPNISAIYDFGQHEDQLFMVMPYLSGCTLAEQLARAGLPSLKVTLRLIARIASALEAAHRIGIAHRDIKPSNIMLDGEADPIVMDFGLMDSPAIGSARLTSIDTVAGTPAYIAPERIIAPESCDNLKADIYSLGVVLYEMLTGRLPFEAATAPQMLVRIVNESPSSPDSWQNDIPPDISALCMRAIAKSPSERIGSMKDFAAALRDFATQQTIDPPKMRSVTQRLPNTQIPKKRVSIQTVAVIVTLSACAVLACLPWMFTHSPPLRVGDVWTGTFRFIGNNVVGDATFTIERLAGEFLSGTYTTEQGEFEWAIEGTIKGNQVSFQLTEAKSASAQAVDVVGIAIVSGQIDGDQFRGLYQDPDSQAQMQLKRLPR